jgi:hypothetical protein
VSVADELLSALSSIRATGDLRELTLVTFSDLDGTRFPPCYIIPSFDADHVSALYRANLSGLPSD